MTMPARLFHRWEVSLARRDTNRVTRSFEWGIGYLDEEAWAADPKTWLRDFARRALAASDQYHDYPPVHDYRSEGRLLTFTSPVRTHWAPNNKVHAWHFPARSRDRVVLVLPQWNADERGHMTLCRMLNSFGLSAVRLSLPYHDRRMPPELHRADYMLSSNLGRTMQSVRQAVIDGRAVLDWLESIGYRRFGILGTSLGSCVAVIALAHDPRLTVSVQNHVSSYFADVVWTGISTRHVRDGIDGHLTLEELREIWMPISPKAYLERLAGTGKISLLVHARYDETFLPHLSRDLIREYARLGIRHRTLALPCGHYTSGRFPFSWYLGLSACAFLRTNL
ncbi:MAG: abhydrolase domain-containing 18 [Acidobacteria bacterium]|nr:abhydrolase domain-containing 18 [Acidobacteriota bacterium]